MANDEAVTEIFENPSKLTPQAACDALADDGWLESLYNALTLAQVGLGTVWKGAVENFKTSPVEVISWRDENQKFHLLVTEIPFDPTRPRFPEQTSLEAAQKLAEENKPAPAPSPFPSQQ